MHPSRPPSSNPNLVSGFFSNLFRRVTFSQGANQGAGAVGSGGRKSRQSTAAGGGSDRSVSPAASESSFVTDNDYSSIGLERRRTDSYDASNAAVSQEQYHIYGGVGGGSRSESYLRFGPRNSFGLSRDFWMRDEAVTECYDCKANFGTFRRKHHCRLCGQIFCHRCAGNLLNGKRFGYPAPEDLRVCDFCLRVTNDFNDDRRDSDAMTSGDIRSPLIRVSPSVDNPNPKRLAAAGPFRKGNDDVDDDVIDFDPYQPEELYSSFGASTTKAELLPPRSFVKLSPERSAFLDHESPFKSRTSSLSLERSKKSPALSTRRKFSSRHSTHHHPRITQIYPDASPQTSPDNSSSAVTPENTNHLSLPTAIALFEMNQASVNHVNLLIQQMLTKSSISRIGEWKKVILSMVVKACSKLDPNVRDGDEIDIRHYVKIKKIPGGLISDSHFYNGVVASKKVIHKQMLKPLQNAKVLLLTFPLEYQRVENQFISLGTLIAQEKDHLKNLVGRLIALRPDVVFVEKTVARLALEFLLDANIIVIPSVKISLMSAVSRTTGAEIVHSVDQLALDNLGTCNSLVFQTFIHSMIPGFRKTFLYVEGFFEHLGCTLVLRGGTTEELTRIKDIVDFLVFAIYNLKLETSLFQDEYAMNPSIIDDDVASHAPEAAEENPYDRAVRLYKTVILSASPNVRFPIPFLLANRERAAAEKGGVPTTEVMEESHIPLLLNADRLSPISHQNIIVLYSNNSPSTIVPCSPPRPHLIDYYRESDLTLGQFIEDTCLGSSTLCQECQKPALIHYRTYSHASGKVSVSVNSIPCPVKGMEGRIVMWSLCRICKESTPFIPMSESTWKYSFGKYLELTFSHSGIQSRTHSCTHDVHRDHMRYFSFQNLAVRFEFEEIVLFDVSGPPMNRAPKPESILKWRQQDSEEIKKQVSDYYTSVLDRIQHFTYEIVSAPKLIACKEAMNEFSKRAVMEKKLLLQLLHQTLIESSPTDCLSLNQVFKALHTNVQRWDQDFLVFIRNYLSTDAKEIRRVTAAQLKRIFVDKEPTLDTKVTFIADAAPPSSKHDAGPFDFDNSALDKNKLPVLNPELEDYHFFTSDTHRRMSVELMAESVSQADVNAPLPELGSSPSIYTTSKGVNIPAMSFHHLDVSNRPRIVSFADTIDENSTSGGGTSQNDAFLKRNSDMDTRSADDSTSRLATVAARSTRPKSIRFEEHTAFTPSSMQNLEKMHLSEEEISPEWNTITGVAGQNEKEESGMQFESSSEARPTSIMKTITNLWTGNPGNFLPLAYPSNPGEHIFPDSNIVVRENEPSSIISFALSSSHYIEKLQAMRNGGVNSNTAASAVFDPDVSDSLPANDTSSQRISIDFEDNNPADIEETLLRETGTHIRYQFWDDNTKLHCKIYFAEQFDALRRNCGISGIYEHSLARCVKWDATGGKSGTFFLKTKDDWLVCKKLSPVELEALLSFSPAYFEYMSQAFFHELPTVLAKIFGFYHIGYKNPVTRKTVKMDILIMENLFYDRVNLSTIFDLKGSVRNRHVQSTGKQNEVLLDKNLLELIFDNPLFIREHSKKILRASVYNDTLFLSKLNVMDYSLLVGIDNESKELVIGIVDFIRTFTWDKKLESWVKETGLLGGGKEPTIVTPRQYKNRFREAMERYFLMVPDKFVIAGSIAENDDI